MRGSWSVLGIALDLRRAEGEGPPGLNRRQRERLDSLIAYARRHSPYYARLYDGLPELPALVDLPPVNKRELMANFDDWVSEKAVTRAEVEAFVADPAGVGTLFRNRYFVCTSSGSTGTPGLFVHDLRAVLTYRAFTTRINGAWLGPREWLEVFRRGFRWAIVAATGGHFAVSGWAELEKRRDVVRRRAVHIISLGLPIAEIVRELNRVSPSILTAYPSVVEILAEEQAAGRLRIRPVFIETGGESMSPATRARAAEAFACPVWDVYGSSEFNPMAVGCAEGWLHYFSDWLILEPVEADLSPTPPGRPSHTVLLTNLVNRVQPIIRYDLGDTVTARPDRCPCGSPLPAIRVEGRTEDVLRPTDGSGKGCRKSR